MPKRKREPDIIAIGPHTQAELYEAAVIHQALKAWVVASSSSHPPTTGPSSSTPTTRTDPPVRLLFDRRSDRTRCSTAVASEGTAELGSPSNDPREPTSGASSSRLSQTVEPEE
jgi:hypothetical protein